MLKKILIAGVIAAAHLAAQGKTIWVDVRTPEEFAEGHIKGAINIPVENIATQIANFPIAKDDTILLYCRSGRRSGIAQQVLLEAGYGKAQNTGSFAELSATGAVKTE